MINEENTDLQQANCDTDSDTCAAQRTFIISHRPRVTCKSFENAGQLKFALLDGEKESSGAKSLLGHWLSRTRCGTGGGTETEHVLDLLGSVFLATTEDVGFATFGIAYFVNLCLDVCELRNGKWVETRTMVP